MEDQAAVEMIMGVLFLVAGLGLLGVPAAIVRFAMVRRRLSKGESALVTFLSYLLVFTALWFMTPVDEQVVPLIPFLAIFTSWYICRYEKQRIW